MTATQNPTAEWVAAWTPRVDTIHRAADLIRTADPDDLARWLAQTELHDHIKADPAVLGDRLTGIDLDTPGYERFGAWKAAQQIFQAAGLPY